MIDWILGFLKRNPWIAGFLGFRAGEASRANADLNAYNQLQSKETEAITEAVRAAPTPGDQSELDKRLKGEGI